MKNFVFFDNMTHLQENFISNLRFYRASMGFSQVEFSEKIGISPNYLNAVENGKNFPSPEVLQKIIDVLNILPYQLFLELPTKNDENENSRQTLMELKQKICSIIDDAMSE